MFNRNGIGFCLLRTLEIFCRGRDPEVGGDDSSVAIENSLSAIVHLFCVIIMTITYKM